MVDNIREWSINKIASIEPVGSKFAIYEEFEEWIELDDEESIETRQLFVKGVLTESLGDGTPKYYNSNILSRYFRKDYYDFG